MYVEIQLSSDQYFYIQLVIPCVSDIDECAQGTHTCGANQVCKNTMSSHTCQCKEGFNYDFETQTCGGKCC